MALDSYRQQINGGRNTRYFGDAPPSATTDVGPFQVGDEVINTAPALGEAHKWVCTTAGANGSTAVFTPVGILVAAADAIADPTGGQTVDDKARDAIAAIIDVLEGAGLLTAASGGG